MFTNQQYIEVNREERHFCALFVHSLLSSDIARTSFTQLISSSLNISLDPENLEIYVEAAALRDYWNSLGNSRRYEELTSNSRRQVLNTIVEDKGYNLSDIDKYPFFWTNGIVGKNTKLWTPGHWNSSEIKKSPLSDLQIIKWAFNAKPDIMILSNDCAILVEAKLESPESKYGGQRIGQKEIQEEIARLLKMLVPAFKDITINNVLLARHSPNKRWPKCITWQNVIEIIGQAPVDKFTKECFEQLRIRYYPD